MPNCSHACCALIGPNLNALASAVDHQNPHMLVSIICGLQLRVC